MSSNGFFHRLPALVIVAVLAVALGCGKSDPFGRQPLKGFVTWEGKPIKVGSITLEPAEGQPAGAKASIRDGAFNIPRTAGPCPGTYNVWLHAYDHSGERVDIPPPKEILPRKFLTTPPTQVTIKKVEGEQVNDFTFDLK